MVGVVIGGVTKEYDKWFKHAMIGFEGSLPFITRTYVDIIIPPLNVKLGKYVSIFEFVDDVGDEREGILVLDHE